MAQNNLEQNNKSSQPWIQLARNLQDYFGFQDLRMLCFDLNIDYEELGENLKKSDRIYALCQHVTQHELLETFLERLTEIRPNVDWPQNLPPFTDTVKLELTLLYPNLFQSVIDEKCNGFVGREFVFSAIESFIARESHGYFTIEADPGVGKSAIIAEFSRRTGAIVHFNIRAQGINKSKDFLENVCGQLIERYELPYSNVPVEATLDGKFLVQLLSEISSLLDSEKPLLLAVDALDEVEMVSRDEGRNVLFLPQILPRYVYFIVTKRPGAIPLTVHSPTFLFDLMTYTEESNRDIKHYLRNAVDTRFLLKKWIDEQPSILSVDSFTQKLAEISQNNFMYLRYILPDIEKGVFHDLDISHLPMGLQGYYEDHWNRMGMRTRPIPRSKLKIIYIICEVKSPASRRLIADFSGESEISVQEILDEWRQFLHSQEIDESIRYSIYHSSFQDFLRRKDIIQATGMEIENIHLLIADTLWNDLFGV